MKYDYVDIKKSKSIYWDWLHLINTRSNVFFKIKELKELITKNENLIHCKRVDSKKYCYVNLTRLRTENRLNVKLLKAYKEWGRNLDKNITEFIHSDEYKTYKKDIYGQPAFEPAK